MKQVGSERYLTETEAAAMLQPFMPTKNALIWLSTDRRTNPVIPYSRLDGDIHYREADLVTFVRYGLRTKPMPRGLTRRIVLSRRRTADRRVGADRRKIPDRRFGAERRGGPIGR